MCRLNQCRRANADVRRRHDELLGRLDADPPAVLAALRATALELEAPPELISEVGDVAAAAGLPVSERWDAAWRSIKTVWGSKWTERAYYSRRASGIPHQALYMAVLVQQVVEAELSFVIHTANPVTRDRGEVYAEVVLGLGETLVGNHPGRSLGFACPKHTGSLRLLSYPSKSHALYGSGLIFRSDSNGEDLPGYAGAGLYESVMATPARRELLDYSKVPLVWDADQRHQVLLAIADLARAVEEIRGCPQDIEGAMVGGSYYVLQTRPQVGL